MQLASHETDFHIRYPTTCGAPQCWRWMGRRRSSPCLRLACHWTSPTAQAYDMKLRRSAAVCWKVQDELMHKNRTAVEFTIWSNLLPIFIILSPLLLYPGVNATTQIACSPLGLKESPGMPWAHSSLIAEVIDEARRQLGVTYDQDSIQWCVLSDNRGADLYLSMQNDGIWIKFLIGFRPHEIIVDVLVKLGLDTVRNAVPTSASL